VRAIVGFDHDVGLGIDRLALLKQAFQCGAVVGVAQQRPRVFGGSRVSSKSSILALSHIDMASSLIRARVSLSMKAPPPVAKM